jgi:hypothetical protein
MDESDNNKGRKKILLSTPHRWFKQSASTLQLMSIVLGCTRVPSE